MPAERLGSTRHRPDDHGHHQAPAATVGDPVLMDRLVGNLPENVIRHNRPGEGWVEVSTGPGPKAGGSRPRVANRGRVLAPEHLPWFSNPGDSLGQITTAKMVTSSHRNGNSIPA